MKKAQQCKAQSGGAKKVSLQEILDLALQHHRSGRLAEAEPLYQKILEIDNQNPDVLHLLGVIACQTGRNEKGAELIGKAVLINDAVAPFHNNYANALKALGRLDKAEAHCRRALEIQPDYPDAHSSLGNVLKQKGDVEGAEKHYARALEIAPDHAGACNNIANIFKDRGQVDEAASYYRRALAKDPNCVEALLSLGNILSDQGKFDEAIILYERLIAVRPNNAGSYNNFGNILMKQGKAGEAIAQYRKALAIKPDFEDVRINLATALEEVGDMDSAKRELTCLLEANPRNGCALNNLGVRLFDEGKIEEAIECYRRAIPFYPESFVKLNLTTAHFFITPAAQWEKLCKDFLGSGKNDIKTEMAIYNRLALCYWIEGKMPELVETLGKCLELSNAFGPSTDKLIKSLRAFRVFLTKLVEYRAQNPFPSFQAREKIAVIGDSHCLSYARTSLKVGGIVHKVEPEILVGCKAWHFAVDRSSKQRAAFTSAVRRLAPETKCIIAFGEIDCRYNDGILPHCKKSGEAVTANVEGVVCDYVRWVKNQCGERDISFLNIPAPNIAGIRSVEKDFSLEDEVSLINVVRLFNERLAVEASAAGCRIVDAYKLTAGQDGRSNGLHHIDMHHLNPDALALAVGRGGA